LIDRAERGNRAVIVHPVMPGTGPDALAEFQELAHSAGVEIVGVISAPRSKPDARFFVGKGKIDDLEQEVRANEADLILFSRPLSAVQERNIEKQCQCRVLDRTTLILDIFAQRARSHEGMLQVELAQLRHLYTSLVRGWTHLERQKGGIGLRGAGETQLETDRRLVGQRITRLRERLRKVGRQRQQSRRQRERSQWPLVALTGYTNAGKSTLFNALTGADVDVRDMQFATLDPTVRQWHGLPSGPALLADTVGFVSELPHELINAFHATLQETREADLLLHVIDVSDPWQMERQQEVDDVLQTIGSGDIPAIRVYNKTDAVDRPVSVNRDENDLVSSIYLSALTGEGLAELAEAVADHLRGDRIRCWIQVEGRDARLRARLFELGAVTEERIAESGAWELLVDVSRQAAETLARMPGSNGVTARKQLFSAEL
jgi:GTP-binding protein HflX